MVIHASISRLICEEDGQDLIEYALLALGIAILSVAIFPSIRTKMGTAFSSWGAQVQAIWVPNDPL